MQASQSSLGLTHRPSSSSLRQVNAFTPPQQLAKVSLATRVNPSGNGAAASIKTAKVVGTGGTAYEEMAKRVLRRRLVRVFVQVGAGTWALTSVSLFLSGGVQLIPTFGSSTTTLLASAFIFALCVLPTLVLRKTLISHNPTPTTSLVARIQSCTTSAAANSSVLVFVASGAILALIWAASLEIINPGARLGLFAATKKHSFHLNERFLIVILANASLGFTYAAKELLSFGFQPQWPHDLLPLQGLIATRLTRLPYALSLPAIHVAAFTSIYLVVRRSVYRFMLSWFGILVKPYIANFIRPTHRSMDIGLFLKVIILQATTVLIWELGKALHEIYMFQPMTISENSSAPVRCLLAGLASSNAYFRHFAQFELAHLSVSSPQRRREIFNDMSIPNTAWQDVWRAEMVILGQSYQTILNRGAVPPPSGTSAVAPAPASASSSSASAVKSSPSNVRPASPLRPLTGGVFLPPKKSLADSVAASILPLPPGPPPSARSAPPPDTSGSPPGPSVVPAIFTSGASSAPPMPRYAPASTAPSQPPARGLGLKLVELAVSAWKVLPVDVRGPVEAHLELPRRLFIRDAVQGRVKMSLRDVDMDVLVIQTLSALISASLTEDPYGRVQRDIPRTLEALLGYLAALEVLVEGFHGAALGPEEKDETSKVLKGEAEVALDAAREGVRQIVETFREHLGAFKLPPKVVRQLQPFVE